MHGYECVFNFEFVDFESVVLPTGK